MAIDAPANVSRLQSLPPGMQSSMLKDILAGRDAELDAIAGPIIRTMGREGAPATVEAPTSHLSAMYPKVDLSKLPVAEHVDAY